MGETSIEKEVIKKSPEGVLLKFNIKRTAKGVELFFKSTVFEDFFKNLSNGTDDVIQSEKEGWLEHKGYKMRTALNGVYEYTFHSWGGGLFYSGEYANLSFLRAVGISEGKKFVIPSVYSRSQINKYVDNLKNTIKAFYKEHLKEIDREVEISIRSTNNDQQ